MTGAYAYGDRVEVYYLAPNIFDDPNAGEWLAATVDHERWNGGAGGFWDVRLANGDSTTVAAEHIRRPA